MTPWLLSLALLAACGEPSPEVVVDGEAPLPGGAFDQAPPPGAGLTLSGPSSLVAGDTVTFVVTAPLLDVGDRVEIGYGTRTGQGFCPYRGQTGGTPCLDITGRVRALGDAIAVERDGQVRAELTVQLNLDLPMVHVQAFFLHGANSQTSNVLPVELRPAWSDLDPRVDALEDAVADHDGALGALGDRLDAAEAGLGDLAAAWSALEVDFGALQLGFAGLGAQVQALGTSLTAEIAARGAALSALAGRVSALEGSVGTAAWSALTGVPAGFADGVDDGFTTEQQLADLLDDRYQPLGVGAVWSALTGVPAGFADGVDHVDDADASPTNELQTLSVSGSTVTLSNGGGSFSNDDADASPTNELQTISRAGSTVTLSNSGGSFSVDDADASTTNELQTITRSGNTVTLSNGGGAFSVDDADASPANELNTALSLVGTTLRLTDAAGTLQTDLASLVADTSPTNELQTVSRVGSTVTLSGGGGSFSVDDGDASASNELQTVSRVGSTVTLSGGGGSFSVDDGDASATNELQSLSVDGTAGNLAISGGNTVALWTGAYAVSSHMAHSVDDISGFTTLQGDDATANATMPFSVSYGGVSYNVVHISTNGWLEFGTGSGSDLANVCLPAAGHTRPFVAWYWDDLVTRGSHIRYGSVGDAPNRVFIVDFEAQTYTGSYGINGQVQIHEGSGIINVKYRDMHHLANGQTATIGFQPGSGKGYPLTCNGKVLDDNRPNEGWSVAPLR